MNNYEVMFIIKPDLKVEAKDNFLKLLNEDIVKNQGKIDVSKVWSEKQSLSYRINKYDQGLYYFITFSIMPEVIVKLKQLWKINDNILRFLILRQN